MAVTKTINPSNQNTGASGTILQGQGLGTADAHSTATYPSVGTSTGSLLRADGTNWSATTSTFPNTNAVSTLLYASSANVMGALTTANNGTLVTSSTGVPSILAGGTAGQVLQSVTSAAPAWSTPTYPSASGSAGQILRSDGTNNVYTTNTYPNTATTGDILIATGTSVIGSLADVAVHQVLVSGGVGVAPAYSATPTLTSVTFGAGTALSTYVTGSWTPNLQINASSSGIAYTTQVGSYIQIGNMVFITGHIVLSSKGSSTGNVTISNLPVSTGSTVGADQAFAIGSFGQWTLASYSWLVFQFASSSAVASINTCGSGQSYVAVTNSQITNTFNIQFAGCYNIT